MTDRSRTPPSRSPATTLSNTDIVGNGFGFWKTIPILRRTCTGSIPGAYTSRPSTRTLPVTLAPGTTSCIRLRHRMNVDLPQPDGPMTAVTAFGAIVTPIPCSTCALPNQALRSRTTIPSAMAFYLTPVKRPLVARRAAKLTTNTRPMSTRARAQA